MIDSGSWAKRLLNHRPDTDAPPPARGGELVRSPKPQSTDAALKDSEDMKPMGRQPDAQVPVSVQARTRRRGPTSGLQIESCGIEDEAIVPTVIEVLFTGHSRGVCFWYVRNAAACPISTKASGPGFGACMCGFDAERLGQVARSVTIGRKSSTPKYLRCRARKCSGSHGSDTSRSAPSTRRCHASKADKGFDHRASGARWP